MHGTNTRDTGVCSRSRHVRVVNAHAQETSSPRRGRGANGCASRRSDHADLSRPRGCCRGTAAARTCWSGRVRATEGPPTATRRECSVGDGAPASSSGLAGGTRAGVWQADLPTRPLKQLHDHLRAVPTPPPTALASLGLCLWPSRFLLQRESWAAEALMGRPCFPQGVWGNPSSSGTFLGQCVWGGAACLAFWSGGACRGGPNPVGPQNTSPFYLGNKKQNSLCISGA